MKWDRERQRAYERSVRSKVLEYYGGSCICCGTTEDLSIDHVIADNDRKFRGYRFHLWLIRNNFPDGFQVLCRPCNHSKAKTSRCWLRHDRFPRGLKLCNSPGHEGENPLPVTEFYAKARVTDGCTPQCKACRRRDDPRKRR